MNGISHASKLTSLTLFNDSLWSSCKDSPRRQSTQRSLGPPRHETTAPKHSKPCHLPLNIRIVNTSFPNFITRFAIALLLVVATAAATAIASPDSLPYLVSELLITGTIDDIPFNLTGTIQQVEVQLASQYPQFHNARVLGPLTAIVTRQLSPLVDNKFGLTCIPVANWDWNKAATTAIHDGVNSLNNIGAAGCRVNALTCARVSCSYDSAIHLCNDNVGWPINRDFRVIANLADDLKNQCNEFNAGKKHWVTGGQQFSTSGWNVIVRNEKC